MSKERFAELLKDNSSVPNPDMPGMTGKEVLGKIWDELAHAGAHGSHELAAAIFRGDAFVMYPSATEGKEECGIHGLPNEAVKEQDYDRSGRE